MLLLPAVAQGWRAGTQRHSPAPLYHALTWTYLLSRHSNVHLNSPAPVCVHRGFDVGHVGSAFPHLSCDLEGPTEWLPLSAVPLCGKKHTYSLQQTLLLLLCVKAFPPVTGAVRRAERCVKYQPERTAGWAAAQKDRGSRPAVDLISPMGLPAGKSCLIWYTCATSCLSRCLALWLWAEAWREGGVCVCVCVCVCPLCTCVRTAGECSCHIMILHTWVFTVWAGSSSG